MAPHAAPWTLYGDTCHGDLPSLLHLVLTAYPAYFHSVFAVVSRKKCETTAKILGGKSLSWRGGEEVVALLAALYACLCGNRSRKH